MTTLPRGTVTFLFTDIEGSTALWNAHPETMRPALARHDEILRAAIEGRGGVVFKTVGDAFCAAFGVAGDAVVAALDAQLALAREDWGEVEAIPVRMALHSGAAELRDGDYFGPPLNRCARLLDAGHGGQCLLSLAAEELVRDALPDGAWLEDLGEHRLRDLDRPEHVHQLCHAELAEQHPPLRSLDAFPNNLPRPTTSFIGREARIEEVAGYLEQDRLVTLTGVGGAGKTRLSLQVAARSMPSFAQGVWFVELAALTDPASVPQALVATLGLGETAGLGPRERLAAFFGARRMLLVLDNCEHLLDACAQLAEHLLGRCPELRILASSREGLGIGGERIVALRSLSMPPSAGPGDRAPSATALRASEAARLFEDRAAHVQPGFTVTDENAGAVAGICRRLDGIPLALELAASRVRMMTPAEIEARLDRSFRLLTGGSRTALPRQQTLRAAMDWSYELLGPQEQAALRRLSVFTGGWDLEGAVALCQGETIEDWEVLDLLGGLLDKSLVVAEPRRGRTRYRLLETVRQYARDRLEEAGEREEGRERHLAYFASFAEEAGDGLKGPDQVDWLDRCREEQANLQAAIRWAREAGDPEPGIRIVLNCRRYWETVLAKDAPADELAALVELAHPAALPDALFVRALLALWSFAGSVLRDRNLACTYLDEAVQRASQVEDPRLQVLLLQNRAMHRYRIGQADVDDECMRLIEESVERARAMQPPLALPLPLLSKGLFLNMRGAYEPALACLQEALDLALPAGDLFVIARIHANLGYLFLRHDEALRARAHFNEVLSMADRLGDRVAVAEAHALIGDTYDHEDDTDAAHRCYLRALERARAIGDVYNTLRACRELANIALREGDAPSAVTYGAEGLASEIGWTTRLFLVVPLLDTLAAALHELANDEDASVVLGARAALVADAELTDSDAPDAALERALRDALGDEAFEEAWHRGRRQDPRAAVLAALDAPS